MSISLLITIALVVVILAAAVGLTTRTRAARPLVGGIGLAALVAGWYVTGLTDLTINGVMSLVAWFQRTVFTNFEAWGLGLVIGGIVFWIVSRFLPKGERAAGPAEGKPSVAGGANPQVGKATPSTPPATGRATGRAPAGGTAGLDPEDAEIEAMLRKRGIM